MKSTYLFRKQTCSFMVNVEISLEAISSDVLEIVFDAELNESSKEAIRKGLVEVSEESGMSPHLFIVSNVIEHWEGTLPLGFELCAKGAARLALGINKESATYSFGGAS